MVIGLLLGLGSAWAVRAHESPVDHVDRELRLWVDHGELHVRYRQQLAERAVLVQLHRIDADGDGAISDRERDGFFSTLADRLAGQLHLDVDGRTLALQADARVTLDAQLGHTFLFTVPLGDLAPGRHRGRLVDHDSRSHPGAYRWAGRGPAGDPGIGIEPREMHEAAGSRSGHPGRIVLEFDLVIPPSK